jgi:hypothetical protein
VKRRNLIYIFIGIIVVIVSVLTGVNLYLSDSSITINNNTSKTITGLEIKYSNSFSSIKIPPILQKQKYKTKLVLPDNFSEGSIKIGYVDNKGENHEEYLEGYIEKGYRSKIKVDIESLDNNGVLSLKVNK